MVETIKFAARVLFFYCSLLEIIYWKFHFILHFESLWAANETFLPWRKLSQACS